jgi:FtsP/CotA-like multicopper oxidase with cupredoxin domain
MPIGLPERIDLRNAVRTEIALGAADQSGPQPVWVRPTELNAGKAPVFRVPRGRAAVIALHNRGDIPVTFALHGHHFRLLDRLDDGWKPFWLDTLVIGPRQTHRIAFVGQHPGNWLMEAMAADWSAPRQVTSYQIT